MGKILCEVALDCVVKTEPIVIKQYGVETIYAVDVEFQSTKTKKGLINLNYPNSLDLEIHVGDVLSVTGELRSIKSHNKCFKSFIFNFSSTFWITYFLGSF